MSELLHCKLCWHSSASCLFPSTELLSAASGASSLDACPLFFLSNVAFQLQVCLTPQRSICLCPTCASANAMAWECPALPLSPAKPDFIWQAQDAKPTAAQGGRQPGLLVCTEQLPLVSATGPACLGDQTGSLERGLRYWVCRIKRRTRSQHLPG